MTFELPKKQTALQLVGPDEMIINSDKAVIEPGPYQILGKVEAVGLCFSDLKLLKQFSEHARKTKIVSGIEEAVLDEIPSYVYGEKPAVPGHEAVVRICAVGERVDCVKLNHRYLVQTDYRWLPTENSNASFGYNFEGGLQEYVLMDQRVITSPEGESMLIPASEDLSASAVALVEPWACVEHAYAIHERQDVKEDGKMLIVADKTIDGHCFTSFLNDYGLPGTMTVLMPEPFLYEMKMVTAIGSLDEAEDAGYDDVIYYGSNPKRAEALFSKVANKGIYNIVQCGKVFGRDIQTQIGRVHYGGIRVVGTTGSDPAQSMKRIPAKPEIRPGDNVNVVGAAGPMGTMNVIRNICMGIKGTTIYASSREMSRLTKLTQMAKPFAESNGVGYVPICSSDDSLEVSFDYVAIMAPVPELVESAAKEIAPKGIINIFAGIPAHVTSPIDLDRYIKEELYFIGTSGSTLDDMKSVLKKVEAGQLDTNMSIGAICGLEHAIEGIRAVEHQKISGKIIVYSRRADLPLTPLEDLSEFIPELAEHLVEPKWTKAAEERLIKHCQEQR
jgi:threonine dehydrogenase-like Zn-dependent dehydrogenase